MSHQCTWRRTKPLVNLQLGIWCPGGEIDLVIKFNESALKTSKAGRPFFAMIPYYPQKKNDKLVNSEKFPL